MRRVARRLGAVWTLGWLAILPAGCPQENPGGAGDATTENSDLVGNDTGAAAESAALLKALSSALESDAIASDEFDDTDEAALFGDAGADFGRDQSPAVRFSSRDLLDSARSDASAGKNRPRSSDAISEPLASGTFAGAFSHAAPGAGVLRGRWFDADGVVVGAFRGRYVQIASDFLPDGIVSGGLFRAKLIDADGRFRGFLHGRYGRAEGGDQLMVGRWRDRQHRMVGLLMGQWTDDGDSGSGTVSGRWAELDVCAEVRSLPEHPFEEGDFGGLDSSAAPPENQAAADASGDDDGLPVDDLSTADESGRLAFGNAASCVDPESPYGYLGGWWRPDLDENEDREDASGGQANLRGRWRSSDGAIVGILHGFSVPLSADDQSALDVSGGSGDASQDGSAESADDADSGDDASQPDADTDGSADDGAADGAADDADPPSGIARGVFYAKVLTRQGEFLALLRGTYGRSAHGLRVFRGHYYDAAGVELGELFGRWTNDPRRPGGPVFGVWSGPELAPSEPQPQE